MSFKYFLTSLLVFVVTTVRLPAAAPGVTESAILEIQQLAQSGAPRLALYSLGQQQPDLTKDPVGWMQWEKVRVDVFRESRDWQGMATRLAALPPDLPVGFQRWARTEQAGALIKLGRVSEARTLLRELIWTVNLDEPEAGVQLRHWRRLIIDSYLAGKELNDAYQASNWFIRDYGSNDLEDRLLRARIQLSDGYPDDALILLKGDLKETQAHTLYLLALLRSGQRPPRDIVKAGLRKLQEKGLTDQQKTILWAVVAEAAQRGKDRGTNAMALERVIAASDTSPLPGGLFKLDADSLWVSYLEYARYLGNRAHYLIGQDGPWFEAAKKAGKKYPVRARSLYATLVLNGASEASRNEAATAFIASSHKLPQGNTLLRELFLKSDQYQDYASIPLTARYVLVDIALADSDITLASQLMATIQTPPEGIDRYHWELRRARVFVLGGDSLRGVAALQTILKTHPSLDRSQLDQFLQVVFDLQTVGANKDATHLFIAVMQRTDDVQLKRELYYWMAESAKAEKAYAEAARLYLKSAMYPDPKAMGPWSQTAHYQAAEALAEAGMVADARQLFEALLRVTTDPGRRAVINHALQKLWLQKPQPG
ncbi:MAG: hypothetical protein LJE73_06400 [Proteobacteria bacterium]|jgi:hypothetical protein|nr:hypothetical protein [Pseudomonadota bacterium]